MQREFYLNEVDYPEFRETCLKVRGKPEKDTQILYKDVVVVKRYFFIEKPLKYVCLGDVLDDIEDDFQRPRCIWSPDCDMSVSDARKETLERRKSHYVHLLRTCENSERLIADISRNPRSGRVSDTFEFGRDKEFWVLRYFNILSSNFRFYKFNGLLKPMARSNTLAAVGIYEI